MHVAIYTEINCAVQVDVDTGIDSVAAKTLLLLLLMSSWPALINLWTLTALPRHTWSAFLYLLITTCVANIDFMRLSVGKGGEGEGGGKQQYTSIKTEGEQVWPSGKALGW